jgi:hypothetical protein
MEQSIEDDYLTVNELTEKLKEEVDNISSKEKEYKDEKDVLKKEDLEKFLLEKTGILVTEGLDVIRELKDVFVNNPDAEEIDALSNAFKAVGSALSVLKDIQIANSKIDSNKEIKEMEIKAKKELSEQRNKGEDNESKVLLTRDELFKRLLEKSDIIEADFAKLDEETPTKQD